MKKPRNTRRSSLELATEIGDAVFPPKKKETRDISSLRVNRDVSSPERFHEFCGAIEAARRLGHRVRLRVVDDPMSEVPTPLDIHAEAEL